MFKCSLACLFLDLKKKVYHSGSQTSECIRITWKAFVKRWLGTTPRPLQVSDLVGLERDLKVCMSTGELNQILKQVNTVTSLMV